MTTFRLVNLFSP